ncbi:MAG: DUF4261 domain-containing protein, partial [Pseudomonadota bacterium]
DIYFSDLLEFKLDEIAEAVKEDFPSLTLKNIFNDQEIRKTNEPIAGVLSVEEPSETSKWITFISAGFPDKENVTVQNLLPQIRASFGFQEEAAHAIENHKYYLHISTKPADQSLETRYATAKILSAVVSVFAKLPVTMAIMPIWASRYVRPKDWERMTAAAMANEFPLDGWISYNVGWDPGQTEPLKYASGMTRGMQHFIDTEVIVQSAPIQPTEVVKQLYGVSYLLLQSGNEFNDGDTLGIEGSSEAWRIRHNKSDNTSGPDTWVLLHPETTVDEFDTFGPRQAAPPPDGQDPVKKEAKPGFLSGLMRKKTH